MEVIFTALIFLAAVYLIYYIVSKSWVPAYSKETPPRETPPLNWDYETLEYRNGDFYDYHQLTLSIPVEPEPTPEPVKKKRVRKPKTTPAVQKKPVKKTKKKPA